MLLRNLTHGYIITKNQKEQILNGTKKIFLIPANQVLMKNISNP